MERFPALRDVATTQLAFPHDSKRKGDEERYIGADGAIAVHSDPEVEWEETNVKFNGVVLGFGASC